jgi:glutamate racemase
MERSQPKRLRATRSARRAFWRSKNIDLLVIACNTATALALPQIKDAAHVPVVGVVEPGAAMAAEVSKNRAAIVIATEATVSSHAYRDALATPRTCSRWRKLVRCLCRWSRRDGSSIP